MKRKHFFTILLLLLLLTEQAAAQGWIIYRSDGTTVTYPYTAVDSIVTYSAATANPNGEPTDGLAVDLGLPSGTKWASHNIGATNPEDYGDYYAWGETETKSNYSASTYSYYDSQASSYIDIGTDIASTQYDVAYVKWGNSWHMPTSTQIDELLNNCTWTWTTYNDVKGYLVAGTNGNSIFLPAAGFRYGSSLNYAGSYGSYWSATRDASNAYDAYYLGFISSNQFRSDNYRYNGFTVRPVSE